MIGRAVAGVVWASQASTPALPQDTLPPPTSVSVAQLTVAKEPTASVRYGYRRRWASAAPAGAAGRATAHARSARRSVTQTSAGGPRAARIEPGLPTRSSSGNEQ